MSAVITALVAKVRMDTSEVTAGSAQVRKEAATVSRVFRSMETDTDKMERKVRALVGQYDRGAISTRQYASALRHLGQEQQKTNVFVKSAGNAFSFLSPQVLAASVAIGAFYGATRGLQTSIKLAAQLEEIGVRFEVLTGNADSAKALVSEMRNLANTTALTFSGLQQNAQTMLAFGVSTEKIIPTLKQLGDITMGDSERMQSLTLAFAQMSAAGRLMGQDLLQMVNAGFNPLQEISKKTGISLVDLKKRMEDGAISAELTALAFQSATSEGGTFNDMLEKSKGTLAGQMRQLQSDLEVIATSIGEEILPAVKELVGLFSGLSQNKGLVFVKELFRVPSGGLNTYFKAATYAIEIATNSKITAEEVSKTFEELKNTELSSKEISKQMGKMLADTPSKAFSNANDELQKQIELLELGAEVHQRNQLYNQGFSSEQVKQIQEKTKYIAQLEEQKKIQEELTKNQEDQAKKQKKAVDDLAKKGREMMIDNNPVAAVAEQIADLNVLLRVGAINEMTFFKERNKILAEGLNRDATVSPDALQAGSQEAYKFINEQMNKQVDEQLQKLEEQRLLQVSQLEATRLTNSKLSELGVMRRVR